MIRKRDVIGLAVGVPLLSLALGFIKYFITGSAEPFFSTETTRDSGYYD